MKTKLLPLFAFALFAAIGLTLWRTSENLFYLINFGFSLVRFKAKPDKCVHCGKCERVCPMNVEASNPARNRVNATECVNICPKKAF